ncbi:MAG: hydroxymethylpyrimidine/phosphomethylpyrimidine kinase [Deltaproteobacteria bacterium]|nr:hydroxymethylpyrimidine/phosphomethylpyrimidine kinase [Deltaproteobacteria bacterium]
MTRPGVRPTVLVVAGFDPSGGAGVTRDLSAIRRAGADATAAVAALTFQSPGRFDGLFAVPAEVLRAEIAAAARAAPPAAVKVGMLGSRENVRAVADFLASCPARAVIDPVWRASAGGSLTDDDGLAELRSVLLPLAAVLTPNAPEAGVLLGRPVRTRDDQRAAAADLCALGAAAVVVKGGHVEGDPAADVVADGSGVVAEIERPRLRGGIHGSGCLFSSTLAAHLALGRPVAEATRLAGDAVAEAILEASQG